MQKTCLVFALGLIANGICHGPASAVQPADAAAVPLPATHPRRAAAVVPPARHPRRAGNDAQPAANKTATQPVRRPAPVATAPATTPATKPASPAEAAAAMPPPPARNPAPPKYVPTTPEEKYYAFLDDALKPLLTQAVAKDDAVKIRQAIEAINGSRIETAQALRDQIKDPVAQKLLDWATLRAGFGTPQAFARFIAGNPEWPDQDTLIRRAEEQAFVLGGSAAQIRAHFKDGPPKTASGYAAMASAFLAEGNEARAREYAAKAWRDLKLPVTLETGFIQRFGKLLTIEDHKWRINRLLLNDSRWSGTRRARAAVARRVIPLLADAHEIKKANARVSVYLRNRSAAKEMAALTAKPAAKAATAKPATGQTAAPAKAGAPVAATPAAMDWGFEFQRAQLLRRQKRYEAAWKILLAAPDDAALLVNPDDWWDERRYAISEALKQRNYKIAHQLAADPGPLSVNPRKDAAFLAGWLALRYIKDAKSAAAHFKVMRESADGPLSASKAAYWLARAHKANGDDSAATAALKDAASFTHTFHGQLARQTLDPASTQIFIPPPARPTKSQLDQFNNMDAMRAAVIAQKAGLPRNTVRAFFNHLRYHFSDEADAAMLAHVAQAFGDTQMAVRIGKTAVARGKNAYYYAYPIAPLPDYAPLRKPPEKALLLGVARQESEFNTAIKSGAGARGLLQVMPITARHICQDYKIKCEIGRLMTDKAYNTQIGSAYIGDRMAEFSGSYALTLSGYNAGPGRTRQWLRQLGDPRKPGKDILDWIEEIPFEETRSYVMKVLSNVQIYRARLGQEAIALRLLDDLKRGNIDRNGKRQDTASQ